MMDHTTKKIKDILSAAYSDENYLRLVKELFDNIREINPYGFRREYSNYSSYIRGSTHVGNYTTSDGKKLIIMAVQLEAQTYVENFRSKQRSYAKKLIENAGCDAAFIAFYTNKDPKWRLSFVRLDYKMKIEKGRLKATEALTPAKRYSYLVGENEPCHTAIERLRIFTDNNNYHPTMDEIEEAFSVEKVTDEFFQLYCEKYHQIREYLEKCEDFVIEAKQHNFTSTQFAKKLMGQIVFLYFLQKKGWLGVKAWPAKLNAKDYKNAYLACGSKSRELIPIVYHPTEDGMYTVSGKALDSLNDDDEAVLASCVKGEPWGTGPRDFMRKLYDLSEKNKRNFYDDYLEPLFYNALNVNRTRDYCAALHCRIPFLSGGLFEPIDGYEWKYNNFNLPNSLFSERTNDDDYAGNGILDIFDRYNFTMCENEPMEREVAIDPEMLGKVFENLLEIKDRKSKGAFYTPREIVHYMCQESLINYLSKTMNLPDTDIRDFILYGDFMKDEDTVKDKREGNGAMYIAESLFKIEADGHISVNRLYELDDALKNVRIADPAVGSGAFPLGMLNEIVRARQNITEYLLIGEKAKAEQSQQKRVSREIHIGRSAYRLKYETIKNCIFAADIEPSAVDIAQLRLWLSLVIDDEITPDAQSELDGHKNPQPLPNLECNILCGNSLIDEFAGIRLINESDLICNVSENSQINFNLSAFEGILTILLETQDELFRCNNTNRKKELKEKISKLRDHIITKQLEGCLPETRDAYEKTKSMTSKPYILWQLDFARVFREKGGFDIVIGNPPYIQLQKSISDDEKDTKKFGDLYENLHFTTFTKTGDIYCLFYEKGFKLLRKTGTLAFITSNKWMRAGYGQALRNFLASNTNPLLLIDFAGQKIFKSATVDVNILIFEKSANLGNTRSCIAKEKCLDNLSVFVEQNNEKISFDNSDIWTILLPIEQSIKRKVKMMGTPLQNWNIKINRGILTGCNEAFIINAEKRQEILNSCQNEDERHRTDELIRPILRGRDIQRYGYNFANLWLISTFPSRHYDIESYPAIKNYLLSFGMEKLEQTGKTYLINGEKIKSRKSTNNKWFETQDSINYWDDFSKRKIMYAEIVQFPKFYLDNGQFYPEATCFIMTGDNLDYLIKLFNSDVIGVIFRKYFAGGGLGQKGYRYKKVFFEKLPLPKYQASPIQKAIVESTSDAQIDELIFDMFGFTSNEKIYIKNLCLLKEV